MKIIILLFLLSALTIQASQSPKPRQPNAIRLDAKELSQLAYHQILIDLYLQAIPEAEARKAIINESIFMLNNEIESLRQRSDGGDYFDICSSQFSEELNTNREALAQEEAKIEDIKATIQLSRNQIAEINARRALRAEYS